jgi:hypothetical protein
MLKQRRFIISYILNNQPQSIDVQTEAETISEEEARDYISESHGVEEKPANITDIQIIGVYHSNDPDVRPGHYQQPEGND